MVSTRFILLLYNNNMKRVHTHTNRDELLNEMDEPFKN